MEKKHHLCSHKRIMMPYLNETNFITLTSQFLDNFLEHASSFTPETLGYEYSKSGKIILFARFSSVSPAYTPLVAWHFYTLPHSSVFPSTLETGPVALA